MTCLLYMVQQLDNAYRDRWKRATSAHCYNWGLHNNNTELEIAWNTLQTQRHVATRRRFGAYNNLSCTILTSFWPQARQKNKRRSRQ